MRYLKVLIILFLSFLCFDNVNAQCAMCRAVVESGLENDHIVMGNGINKGIYILMVIPYVLLGVLFYNMYKVRNLNEQS